MGSSPSEPILFGINGNYFVFLECSVLGPGVNRNKFKADSILINLIL